MNNPDTIDDAAAEWVRVAHDKWADYQRLLATDTDNYIALGLRERGLAELVPHLLVALGQQRTEVETWLKARRDDSLSDGERTDGWWTLDDALDDLREHMHTGTPLTEPVRGPHYEEQG